MDKKTALTQFHKETISSVAEELFQDNGYEKTTVDDIAKAADYSKATLYVYFKSKEEIKHYIVLNAMKLMLDKITAGINTDKDAFLQYRAICQEMTAFSSERPYSFQSLIETIRIDERYRKENPVLEEIYQVGEGINDKIAEVLQNGIQQNLLRDDIDCLPAGFFFWAAISGVIQIATNKAEYIADRMKMSPQDYLDFSFTILFRSVLKEGVQYDG